jgi:hypothetical protein
MNFSWWWLVAAPPAIWIVGWCVTVIITVFFNPLATEQDKRLEDLGDTLQGAAIINLFLWPFMLPELLDRRKLLREIKTGKRPGWIIQATGEKGAREWTLSDGTTFGASASTSGESSEPADILADYGDDSLTADVQFRVRMVAPEPGAPTDWAPLKFTPRGPEPDAQDSDAIDDYWSERYEASVPLPRGKYAVEFRVPNRSGTVEECSGVTLIVSDPEDYGL